MPKETELKQEPLEIDNLPPPPKNETFTALGFQKSANLKGGKDGNDA